MKAYHDKNIMRKYFEPSQEVLLYNSRLHLFPGKLKSRWIGLFIVKTVYPYRSVEIENPQTGAIFKVNGQRLKPFFESYISEEESIPLEDPVYKAWLALSNACCIVFFILYFVFFFSFLLCGF